MAQESDVVTVTATLTKSQLTALLTAFGRMHLRRLRQAMSFAVSATVLFVVVDLVSFGGVRTATFVVAAVLSAIVAVMLLGAPWLQSRTAARRAGVGVPTTWTFTYSGVTWRSALGESEIGWDRVVDLRRTDEVVAMLWGPRLCAAGLPAHVFDTVSFEQVGRWWRGAATADGGTPTDPPAAAAEPAGADVGWGGPAWDDAVVVRGPMTMPPLRAMQRAVARGRTLLVAVTLVLLAGPLLLTLAVGGAAALGRADLGPIVLIVLTLVGLPLLRETSLRRANRRIRGADALWRATPAGLTLQTSLGRSEVPWVRVDRFVERHGLLVASTRRPRTAIAMPTATLSRHDLASVRRWAAAARGQVPVATAVPPLR